MIIGVVIGLIGMVGGISGLVGGGIIAKKHRYFMNASGAVFLFSSLCSFNLCTDQRMGET